MTIKQQGGIFGRNPTFNDVNVDGTFNGTSGSFSTTLDVSGNLTTYGENVLEGGLSFQRNYATWPYFVFSRAQGTRASPTSIGNGQTLSEIYFSGYTNGQYRNGAKIQAKVSAGVSGDEIPTTLTFSTTTDGANSPTDRWAINHTGNLVALQSGNGIDFSATSDGSGTTTSELFSDYEEGSWSPSFTGSSGNPTVTYTEQSGIYTKVGRQVTFFGTLRWSAYSGGSGVLYISGLPFTAGSLNGVDWFPGTFSDSRSNTDWGTYTQLSLAVQAGQSRATINILKDSADQSTIGHATVGASGVFKFTATYFV